MIEEDFFWSTFCEGVAIGDTSDANSYAWGKLEGYSTWKAYTFYSIIDTGSSALVISQAYFESLITEIMNRVPDAKWQYIEDYGVIYTECEHEYPDLFFLIDGRWVAVAAKDYV